MSSYFLRAKEIGLEIEVNLPIWKYDDFKADAYCRFRNQRRTRIPSTTQSCSHFSH